MAHGYLAGKLVSGLDGMATITVQTPLGALRGSEYTTARGDKILCFQGVPYGKPPVGDLRFKAPVPVEPWEGVRSAESAPPPAATIFQDPSNSSVIQAPGSSEDCLYLNVYTPDTALDGGKLPVFVFIHGGGFNFGCGNKIHVGPDYIVPKGVILVTINYRINALGFLSFETAECSGNYGLKDQNLGLKWVQANISSFGGDPENVTICGESAGAASVQYHTLSPMSHGLFHRAVALSASALNRWAYSRYPAKSAFLLAKRLGYTGDNSSEALQYLKNVPCDQLLEKTVGIFQEIEGEWAGENILAFPFVPTAEPEGTPDAFLTKTPAQALKDGDTADVPYMTGICDSECIFVLKSHDYQPKWDDDEEFQAMLPKEVGLPLGSDALQSASMKLREFYFPNGTSQEGFIKAISAVMFTHGIFKTTENLLKDPKKTTPNYLYIFTASRSDSQIKSFFKVQNVKGSSHADDLEYIFFSQLNPFEKPEPIAEGTEDNKVMENFTTLLTDFAKSGVPSAEWPVVDGDLPYLEIGPELKVKKGFFVDEGKVWDEIYEALKS